MTTEPHKESEARTWIITVLLVGLILAKGFFAFFVVGDRGQPGWDFPVVADVPAESPYAIYKLLPYPQHVRGEKGE
jgi:mono/diheme cytochrome c family protein